MSLNNLSIERGPSPRLFAATFFFPPCSLLFKRYLTDCRRHPVNVSNCLVDSPVLRDICRHSLTRE